jgi:hypothetical protein
MSGIMDPAFRGDKPGNHLQVGINRDRRFEEVFSNFSGPFRKIVAAISAGKSGRIDRGYGDSVVVGVKQVQGFSEGEPGCRDFIRHRNF